ncbi:hypothetical protein F8154_09250 [Alkaliphilus pronyensis]|uniref:Uncharacterized protein n=2 Tax=Alkaliphilus pronyensis TaxID=1482732 RepID=A0A6I0FA83_9FIRM|nr:hypothetical protein F8154_09250 [Alkaliphilus pronyensis]
MGDKLGIKSIKDKAHKAAEAVSNTKRAEDEVGTGGGNTVKRSKSSSSTRRTTSSTKTNTNTNRERNSRSRERTKAPTFSYLNGGLITTTVVPNVARTAMYNPIVSTVKMVKESIISPQPIVDLGITLASLDPGIGGLDKKSLDHLQPQYLDGETKGMGDDYSITTMVDNVKSLENLATKNRRASGVKTSVNELVLHYIRRDRYNDSSWTGVAGKIDSGFIEYVNKEKGSLTTYFKTDILVPDPLTGYDIDFVHLTATLNAHIYKTGYSDVGLEAVIPEYHIDNLAGWAGDFQQLMRDVILKTNNSDEYTVLYEEARRQMGNIDPKKSDFPMRDVLADADAVNICNKLGNKSLSSVLSDYYLKGGSDTRYRDFVSHSLSRGLNQRGRKDPKAAIAHSTAPYTMEHFMMPADIFKWPLYKRFNVSPTSAQSRAIKDAFTDFIWEQLENEKNR